MKLIMNVSSSTPPASIFLHQDSEPNAKPLSKIAAVLAQTDESHPIGILIAEQKDYKPAISVYLIETGCHIAYIYCAEIR